MKVTIEEAGPCRRVLTVEAAADEVRSEYDGVVREFSRVAKIDGFRPGKAPVAVVGQYLARPIEQETKDRLLPRLYRQALKEKGLSPVAAVDVQDVAFNKATGINFKVVVDIPPEFKLPKYKKFSVKKKPVEVKDSDVGEHWNRLLESRARYVDVTGRPVQMGDLVRIDYMGRIEGRTVKSVAPHVPGLGEGQEFWVLTAGPEFLPGFGQALVGMTVDSSKEISVTFPAEYQVALVAGKTAIYQVSVKGLRERKPAEVNAEFLKGLKVETEQALRDRIRAELLAVAEKEEDDRLKEEIAKFLLEKTEFDLPQTVVDEGTNAIVQGIVRRSLRQGIKQEELVKQRDEIVTAARRSAAERVKLAYILERVAQEENITVDDKELDERLTRMAAEYQVAPEKFRAEMEKDQVMDKLRSDVCGEKTMNFLLESALQSKGWFG